MTGNSRPSCLIVGGDSRLSQTLKPLLHSAGWDVTSTTRRTTPADGDVFLSFDDIEAFEIPQHITHAAIVGGVVDYKICDNQYDYAHTINCKNIPALAGRLLEAGAFVCYLSTNTVFTPAAAPAREYDIHNPAFNYAALKSKSEHQVLTEALRSGLNHQLAILRLTKNVGATTLPFDTWITALSTGTGITAFDDLFFAPVLFSHSATAILRILADDISGMFHMSGEHDLNYADFAAGLIDFLKLPAHLLTRTSSTAAGVKLNYAHPITALNMDLTTARLGIKPSAPAEIYAYLAGLLPKKNSAP